MDSRSPLPKGYTLCLKGNSKSEIILTISDVIGYGGSCIVYDAFYTANAGVKKTVRVKECYPYKPETQRLSTGELRPNAGGEGSFNRQKERMIEEFKVENELFYSEGLSDSVSNTLDIYFANNTVYSVAAYIKDRVLSEYRPNTLKEGISIVKSLAQRVGAIHKKGLLYLDIKPENVLIAEETNRVILFDFDSLVPIEKIKERAADVRLFCTKEYAALELRLCQLSKIGVQTDVYSVGVLLFKLLFNRPPTPQECEPDFDYDFSQIICGDKSYCDHLYFSLKNFFGKTLSAFYLDRYPDMEKTASALEMIEKYADNTVPYIISTKVNRPYFFVGRQKELESFSAEYNKNDSNYIFLTGMGGIGKSAFMKEFISLHRNEYDAVLYLNYNGSIRRLITDDKLVPINTVSKIEEETGDEYYSRKLTALKSICNNKNVIAVFDSYDNLSDPDFTHILGIFTKAIFITRFNLASSDLKYFSLGEMDNRKDLYAVFEHGLNRRLSPYDFKYLDKIIEKSSSNTLILELAAKQIFCSFLNLEEAASLMEKFGFSQIAAEKVELFHDDVYYHKTVLEILTELFSVNRLSENQIALIKIVSLFEGQGISANFLKKLCGLSTFDGVNLLIKYGWINAENNTLYVHSVIGEIIKQAPISQAFVDTTNLVMNNLCNEFNKQDSDSFDSLFYPSEYLLNFCENKPELQEKNYEFLLYNVIKNYPTLDEEKSLEMTLKLLKNHKYLTPYELIDLYEAAADIYQSKGNLKHCEKILMEAYIFAKKCGSKFILAQFYDILARYYNFRYEKGDVAKCLKCCDKAIKLAKASFSNENEDCKKLLATCLLFKANVLTRNNLGTKKETALLIAEGEKICSQIKDKYAQVKYELYITKAWWEVFFTRDITKINDSLNLAYEIIDRTYSGDLALVVHIIIPAARIYYDLYEEETAVNILEKGVELCSRHSEAAPYIRQKKELEEVIRDIKAKK